MTAPADTARAQLAQVALARLAGTLDALPTEALRDLAEGRGRLAFSPGTGPIRAIPHRPTSRPTSRPQPAGPPDLTDDVTTIRAMTTPAEVASYLSARRLTVPVLRRLARALGPTVPASGRNRAELVHDIVEGTVGFRARSRALSGGAWSS